MSGLLCLFCLRRFVLGIVFAFLLILVGVTRLWVVAGECLDGLCCGKFWLGVLFVRFVFV